MDCDKRKCPPYYDSLRLPLHITPLCVWKLRFFASCILSRFLLLKSLLLVLPASWCFLPSDGMVLCRKIRRNYPQKSIHSQTQAMHSQMFEWIFSKEEYEELRPNCTRPTRPSGPSPRVIRLVLTVYQSRHCLSGYKLTCNPGYIWGRTIITLAVMQSSEKINLGCALALLCGMNWLFRQNLPNSQTLLVAHLARGRRQDNHILIYAQISGVACALFHSPVTPVQHAMQMKKAMIAPGGVTLSPEC